MARVHTQVALTKLLATSTQMQLVIMDLASSLLTVLARVVVPSLKMRVVTALILIQWAKKALHTRVHSKTGLFLQV
jgi:hypothetical protein